MKKCLDCEHLEASMVECKDVPKAFQKFLQLYCRKYNHTVVGYDRKGENTDCLGFRKRSAE